MTFKKAKNVNGTHFQGSIETTLAELTRKFGPPHIEEPSEFDKVGYEWMLEFSDGTVATIYDWKRYTKQPLEPNEKFEFHIGGYTNMAVKYVNHVLQDEKAWHPVCYVA